MRSRVCRSVLWTDINISGGVIFDDCVLGETYYKDCTIWNKSEIELRWLLNTVDLSSGGNKNRLEFSDYESGESLDFAPIPAYSPKRVRVTFIPKEIGEFSYTLQIENENDSSNTIESMIRANVRSVLREETLIVNTGNVLDFTECCAGIWKRKDIVLRNVSDSPLEVSFSCDDPNVMFQLRTGSLSLDHLKRKESQHLISPPGSEKIMPERLQDISSSMARSSSELSASMESLSSRGSSPGPHQDSDSYLNPYFGEERNLVNGEITNTQEEITKIDEVLMRPGKDLRIEVCYKPEKEPLTSDHRGGRLVNKNFRITISYSQPRAKHSVERKSVQCIARTCTAFIEVSPSQINFGDTDGIF